MAGAVGLMGMAGMAWWRYQAKILWGGDGEEGEGQQRVPFLNCVCVDVWVWTDGKGRSGVRSVVLS